MVLKLYANLISQPSRAVEWALRVKKVDHELVQADFGGPVFSDPAFIAINPNKLIPVVTDGDFTLFEGAAILTYLSETYGWTDLLPTEPKARAKVNEYLHWHHTNARWATPRVLVPHIHAKAGAATPEDTKYVETTDEIVDKIVGLLETFLVKDFVAQTDAPTIADYFAYCEYVQLEYQGLIDAKKYPKTTAWLARMKEIPHHDEVHAPLREFMAATNVLASP